MEILMKASVLRDVVGVISGITDEVRMEFGSDGLNVLSVDQAHVALVRLQLSKDAFDDYKVGKGETVCLDLVKLRDVLKLANIGDVLKVTTKDGRLTIAIGRLTRRMNPLDESGINVPKKVPDMKLSAKVKIPLEALSVALRASETVADTVGFTATADGFVVRAGKDAEDTVEAIYTSSDVTMTTEKDVTALYSLDYVMKVLHGIPSTSKELDIEFGQDFPARFNFEFADGKGQATYLIAPRIEGQ